MQDRHISSAFDRDLEQLQILLMKMGGLVESSITDATNALMSADEELATKVRGADAAIDQLEEEINQQAGRIIALRSPVASDLRTVLTVIKISSDLERCGDYMKNMAKRTTALAQLPVIDEASPGLRRMAREVGIMLKGSLDAFIQRDAEMADEIRLRDIDVDRMYNAMFRELLTHMMEDSRNITACMHLHFIAKNMERMGDHVTSIAEQVIYLVTGEHPGDSRPKGDRTSFDLAEGVGG